MELEVAVLEDGTRVINQKTIMGALGRSLSTGRHQRTEVPLSFVAAGNLVPYFPETLPDMFQPIEFRVPGQTVSSTCSRAQTPAPGV